MGIFDDFIGMFSDDPAEAGDKYLQQIPGLMKPYYDPYIDVGKSTLSQLQQQYQDLLQDPGSILSRIGKGYRESPGYQFTKSQGLQGINNAAAAGGMLGSAQHQQQAGALSGNLADQDYNNYLQNAIRMWGAGLGGKEDLNKIGFDAASGLAGNLGQNMMSRGNFAYEGQAGRNKMLSGLIGAGLGAAGMGF